MRPTENPLIDPRELVQKRLQTRMSVKEYRDHPATRKPSQKYGNRVVHTADGLRFDSKAEHKRWVYLDLLQRAGEITELQRQVPFELIPAQELKRGGTEKATKYLADFTYRDKAGVLVVEDVKGAVTPEYRLKRKLMLWVHGIEIQEIRS